MIEPLLPPAAGTYLQQEDGSLQLISATQPAPIPVTTDGPDQKATPDGEEGDDVRPERQRRRG
jgi:hypothetical protein